MKKLVSMTLVLIAILVLCSSAFAKTEDEIFFRSIPWGSTYEETMKILKDLSITWDSPEPYQSGKKELVTGFTVTSKRVMDFSVAGNKITSVTLWFAYDINKPSSKESALFIQAKYTFDSESNASGVEDDLKEKMGNVYTAPDDYKSSSFGNDFTHCWYWYGGNNTSVMLYHKYTEPFFIKSMASDELELIYTSGQFEQFLNTYYDYLNKENNKNTDGL